MAYNTLKLLANNGVNMKLHVGKNIMYVYFTETFVHVNKNIKPGLQIRT